MFKNTSQKISSLKKVMKKKLIDCYIVPHQDENFSEYVPLFIILLLLSEILQTLPKLIILIVCLLFTYGRLAHAICFAFFEYNPFLRISGMLFTYFGLLFFSFNLLWHFFLK